MSRAVPIELKERNINKNPIYNGKLIIDISGLNNKSIPTSIVIIPNTKLQPQLSSCFLLVIENITSRLPDNRKDKLNKIESAKYDSAG
jgi:hypothetical protein